MSSKQNHKIIKIAITALALGVGAPVVANQISNQVFAASAPYDTNEMRSFVRNTLAQNKVRGTVVVIKDDHAQQISYGYGYYGRRLGAGNTKVVYPVCSLQKVITGAIITQLISEGKFNQDTKISRWYPNLKNADKITVGNLLTHTSGLLATGTEVNRGINYSEGDAINWVVNRINQLQEGNPGNFYYNNTNYILLAGIIRQVTNQSYEANVKSRIINKLGLKRTFFYPDIPKNKTDAISYTWRNKNYQNAQYVKRSLASQLPGAGNLFSTPMDYYRIQVALTDGRILTKDQFNYLTHLQSRVTSYSGEE